MQHAKSLAVCVALVVAAYLVGRSTLEAQGPGGLDACRIRLEYLPHPRDIVNLVEGTPFTVPSGKILIIRDFAVSDVPVLTPPTGNTEIRTGFKVTVDDQTAWESRGSVVVTTHGSGGGLAVAAPGSEIDKGPLSVGVRVNAGQTVTISTAFGILHAAGFLAPE